MAIIPEPDFTLVQPVQVTLRGVSLSAFTKGDMRDTLVFTGNGVEIELVVESGVEALRSMFGGIRSQAADDFRYWKAGERTLRELIADIDRAAAGMETGS